MPFNKEDLPKHLQDNIDAIDSIGTSEQSGNSYLLNNIEAFGQAIADMHHRVKQLEGKYDMALNEIDTLKQGLNELYRERDNG